MAATAVPEFHLQFGAGHGVVVIEGPSCRLSPVIQAPPLPPDALPAPLSALSAAHLAAALRACCTSDGHVLSCTFSEPQLWADCSLPESIVEPTLPTSSEEEQVVPFHEVSLHTPSLSVHDTAAMRQRIAARQRSSDTWRGFSVSMPFTLGASEELPSPAASGPAALAAADAEAGSWLSLLERGGRLPHVPLPGLASVFAAGSPGEDGAGDLAAGGHTKEAPGVQDRGPGEAGAAGASTAAQPQLANVQPGSLFDGLWLLRPDQQLAEEEEEESEPTAAAAPAAAGGASHAVSQGSVLTAVAASSRTPPHAQLHGLQHTQSLGPFGTVAATAAATGVLGSTALADAGFMPPDTVDTLLQDNDATVAAAAAPAAAAAVAEAAPPARAAGDLQWAVRGGWPNLDAEWQRLLSGGGLALPFPFQLDTFQKEAVLHLEAGHSVFVAAHTSAGKTAVAEYALALAAKHCARAVYTSPIKTISNQKFRDFSSKFDVGLLTGDVQIRPEASALIMTTEILRSMLYKGADLIRDIEFVVFDEVHYVNDADRGVVWEEVIIMLPEHVTMVMLSATVPNALDFADWVGRTKRRVMYVTATSKRPVPLEHALYYGGELHTIARAEGPFIGDGHARAVRAHRTRNAPPEQRARPTGRADGRGPNNAAARSSGRTCRGGGVSDAARRQAGSGGRGPGGGPNSGAGERVQLMDLVALLRARDLLPTAVFCFSKKRCDMCADALAGLDLTTSVEKHAVHVFVEKCLARLRAEDQQLPQILRMRAMMRRGLAVHHAGLLPIMKEVVEMLFCGGYIKVLFCTETFAMGVNAPTRTVVFHSLRKHDGRQFRSLLPAEYTQMAGRAGRRGLDAVGHVVIACWEDVPPEGELRVMMTGKGGGLISRFRLTYGMILNLLRVEDLKVEDILRRSFAEFHAQRAQPEKLAALARGQRQLEAYSAAAWPPCFLGCSREEVSEWVALSMALETLNEQVQAAVMSGREAHSKLTPGRLLVVAQRPSGASELGLLLGGPGMERASTSGAGAGGSDLFALSGTVPKRGGGATGFGAVLGPERRLWVLLAHHPGPQDPPPGVVVKSAPTPVDEFEGYVLRGAAERASAPAIPGPLPRYGTVGGEPYMLCEVAARDVVAICKDRIPLDSAAVLSVEGRGLPAAMRALVAARDRAPGGLPEVLDPRLDLGVRDFALAPPLEHRARALAAQAAMRCASCPGTPSQAALVRSEMVLTARLEQLGRELSDASLQQMPEFHQRVSVLSRLGYVDASGAVTIKGRAAVEINSTQDELVATEVVFRGLLAGLEPEEAVALLSALVFQEKSEVEPQLPPRLAAARDDLAALVAQCASLQAEAGLPISVEEYAGEVLHMGLMEVVYEWARGTPFAAITALTDVMEGSIVRAIVRLDQTCRELMDAARVMGNTQLFSQMEAASALIKRDVVFAASLYCV